MNRLLLGFIFLLMVSINMLTCGLRKQKQEIGRLRGNQSVLFSDIEFYRTKDSLSAASVQRLLLDKKELEKHKGELAAQVKQLGVKLKRLESVAATSAKTEVEFSAPLTERHVVSNEGDSVVSIVTFGWSDPWVNVKGELTDSTVNCIVETVDTLIQVVHRVPRKFWFLRWGTKSIRQEVVSRNPHSQIFYTEYIDLK